MFLYTSAVRLYRGLLRHNRLATSWWERSWNQWRLKSCCVYSSRRFCKHVHRHFVRQSVPPQKSTGKFSNLKHQNFSNLKYFLHVNFSGVVRGAVIDHAFIFLDSASCLLAHARAIFISQTTNLFGRLNLPMGIIFNTWIWILAVQSVNSVRYQPGKSLL